MAPQIPFSAHFFLDNMFPWLTANLLLLQGYTLGTLFTFLKQHIGPKMWFQNYSSRKLLIICLISRWMKEGTKMILRHVCTKHTQVNDETFPWGINNHENLREWNFPIRGFDQFFNSWYERRIKIGFLCWNETFCLLSNKELKKLVMNITFSLVHLEVDENLYLMQEVILGQWRLVIKAQTLVLEQERKEIRKALSTDKFLLGVLE